MPSSAHKFNPYKQTKKKDVESGVFEKPSKIVVKTVLVNGVPQEFPVKVYEPLTFIEPDSNPVNVTPWADRIKRRSNYSE
jgi:hypothetical protein